MTASGPIDADRLRKAKAAIWALLDTELALVKAEAIARLGERYHNGDTRNFDSHITGMALNEMRIAGDLIVEHDAPSKGGHRIDTYQPTDQRRRRTAITAAAARKRALYARYLGWAGSTVRYPSGFIGPAGEAATRSAILESGAIQPAEAYAGPVSRILNVSLPGAADSGGYMNPIIAGIPQPPVTVLFEVKNIREWIYPSSSELYQVLHKCVVLQHAQPTVPILPILVCRRAQQTSFYMAQQLGFFIIDMGAQFIGPYVTESALLEVRNELAFGDLYLGNGPSLRVRDRLKKHLPAYVSQYAATWATTALDLDMAGRITAASSRISTNRRYELVAELRELSTAKGKPGGW